MIPARFARLLAHVATPGGLDDLQLAIGGGLATVRARGFTATTRLTQGVVPGYRATTDEPKSLACSVRRRPLVSVLQAASSVAADRAWFTLLHVADGMLRVSAQNVNEGHQFVAALPAESIEDARGPFPEDGGAFNARLLRETLETLPGENVVLWTEHSGGAMRIESPGHDGRRFIMPLRK
jgi:DNA polymerase III sliding clamp (beta) subunit (PCNA family)